ANFVADVINKTLFTLITSCTKADGIRDYFFVSAIGYSGSDARSLWKEAKGYDLLLPLSYLAKHPLRIEERTKLVTRDDGETVSQRAKFPVWIEPKNRGRTSMCAGLRI